MLWDGLNYRCVVVCIFILSTCSFVCGQEDKTKFSGSRSVCLSFGLADTFGDGWGSAKLRVVDLDGQDTVHYPQPQHNSITNVKYCFDTSNSSKEKSQRITAGVIGLEKAYAWEIYWTATIDDTRQPYIGSYNTFMSFELIANNGKKSIIMKESHNILKPKNSCESCEVPSPKASVASKSTSNSDTIKTQTSTLSYNLYGNNDKWYSLNGYGSTFSISSAEGKILHYYGSFCGSNSNSYSFKNNQKCNFNELSAGQYIWRVSGIFDQNKDDIAWDFCNVHGGAGEELIFTIDNNGLCTAMNTMYSKDITASYTSTSMKGISSKDTSSVTRVEVELVVEGIESTTIVKNHREDIPKILSKTLKNMSINEKGRVYNVTIGNWNTQGTVFDVSPKLSFTYSAIISPNDYGYNNTDIDITTLTKQIQEYMQISLESGLFTADLIEEQEDLKETNYEYESKYNDHVHNNNNNNDHDNNNANNPSTLEYYTGIESLTSSSISSSIYFPSIIVSTTIVLIGIAFVLVLIKRISSIENKENNHQMINRFLDPSLHSTEDSNHSSVDDSRSLFMSSSMSRVLPRSTTTPSSTTTTSTTLPAASHMGIRKTVPGFTKTSQMHDDTSLSLLLASADSTRKYMPPYDESKRALQGYHGMQVPPLSKSSLSSSLSSQVTNNTTNTSDDSNIERKNETDVNGNDNGNEVSSEARRSKEIYKSIKSFRSVKLVKSSISADQVEEIVKSFDKFLPPVVVGSQDLLNRHSSMQISI